MDSSTQHKMSLVACRLLIISIWIGTLTRPLVVDLNPAFTLIGVFEGIIAILLYATVRAELLGRRAPVVVCLAMPLLGLPLVMISGGVNSPFVYFFPIFPFFATLLVGARFGWISTGVICAIVIPMGIAGDSIVDITDSEFSRSESILRTYWTVGALLVAAALSSSFSQLNENLSKTLREEANLDYLTRIANRRGLEKILDRESRSARRHNSWLSLILVDIDDFKKFNDTQGHTAGDRRLVSIANALRHASRVKQDYIGRWGGEEFLVILPDTDPGEAKAIAELLRKEIEFLEDTDANDNQAVTATLGCCAALGEQVRISAMIEVADRALYAGKSRGKNQVVMGKIRERKQIQQPFPDEEPF